MKDIIINNFSKELRKYKSLAIIGLSKNAGKTTSLNSILELLRYQKVSLTSIGYDGEEADLVFETKKPTILIKKGMLVATAKKCLLSSDVHFEILDTTGFNTPLGQVIIAKALSDGLIEIAGPSTNSQIDCVINLLQEYDKDALVIVDGALNRKSFADPSVCEATILCSGMSGDTDIDSVVLKTEYALKLFDIKVVDKNLKDLINNEEAMVLLINDDNEIVYHNKMTILNQENHIISLFDKHTRFLYINGPLTDKLCLTILKKRNILNDFKIIVDNATKVFITSKVFDMLKLARIEIGYLNKINIEIVAMNPQGIYKLVDSDELVNKMREYTNIRVIDFVKGVNNGSIS